MNKEFQRYRFSDFLRASAVAPLASIPAVLLVDLFIILPDLLAGLAMFGRLALLLIMVTLPTSYFSTAIFGALGIGIANLARVPVTVPLGAVAGVVCGAITGLLRLLLAEGTLPRWLYILVGAICGLFVGVAYPKLLNRSVQHHSTNRNVLP